jgi:hypothetical protein
MSKSGVLSYLQYEPLWRGDLSPLGCEATQTLTPRCIRQIELTLLGLLRNPAGINPLATGFLLNRLSA